MSSSGWTPPPSTPPTPRRCYSSCMAPIAAPTPTSCLTWPGWSHCRCVPALVTTGYCSVTRTRRGGGWRWRGSAPQQQPGTALEEEEVVVVEGGAAAGREGCLFGARACMCHCMAAWVSAGVGGEGRWMDVVGREARPEEAWCIHPWPLLDNIVVPIVSAIIVMCCMHATFDTQPIPCAPPLPTHTHPPTQAAGREVAALMPRSCRPSWPA